MVIQILIALVIHQKENVCMEIGEYHVLMEEVTYLVTQSLRIVEVLHAVEQLIKRTEGI